MPAPRPSIARAWQSDVHTFSALFRTPNVLLAQFAQDLDARKPSAAHKLVFGTAHAPWDDGFDGIRWRDAVIKRILAGICEPTVTASVADYVVDIAEPREAQVTAVAVTDMKRLKHLSPQPIGAKMQEIVQEKLDMNERAISESTRVLQERLAQAGMDCQIRFTSGDPVESVVQASRYHDLLVTGLTGFLDHGVTSEPRDALIRMIGAGVHPILAVNAPARPITRVLVAYSGSTESARALRQFAAYQLWPSAALKVVHFGARDDHGHLLLTEARSYLENHGFHVETDLLDASPARGLSAVAEEWSADLLVIGNSAKSMLRRQVLGDTAISALRDARLPVFLSQ